MARKLNLDYNPFRTQFDMRLQEEHCPQCCTRVTNRPNGTQNYSHQNCNIKFTPQFPGNLDQFQTYLTSDQTTRPFANLKPAHRQANRRPHENYHDDTDDTDDDNYESGAPSCCCASQQGISNPCDTDKGGNIFACNTDSDCPGSTMRHGDKCYKNDGGYSGGTCQ